MKDEAKKHNFQETAHEMLVRNRYDMRYFLSHLKSKSMAGASCKGNRPKTRQASPEDGID